ncbi:MAG: hypothetical protein IKD20_06240 [Clostridia bacterium]|nr:hypothetical protein [Clostridia bacterium]
MKKIVLIFSIVCSLVMASCSTQVDAFEQSISYKQLSMLVGSTDNFTISVVASVTESPYMADGIAESTHPQCKIVVKSSSDLSLVSNLSYRFEYNNEMIEGTFQLDKLRGVLYADTGVIDHSKDMKSITLYDDTTSIDVSLSNVMEGSISVDEVIDIAKEEFATDIEANTIDGVYQKEVYLKYIADQHKTEVEYYWYVALISKDRTFSAILISPTTGEVIARRK